MRYQRNSGGEPQLRGSGYPGSLVENAFQNAYVAGVLHIASAGNSGFGEDTVGYPGKFDSVVAVAATDPNDVRAYFSSTGYAVEISAPGTGVRSTRIGGGYVSYSGTSMASPHVAGVAALVLAGGSYEPAAVRQRLIETADDLGDPGLDDRYGFGLVDAVEANEGGPAPPTNQAPVVTIANPGNGERFTSADTVLFSGSASDAEDGDLSASLVWKIGAQTIGTGASFSAALPEGDLTITASATDSGSRSATSSVNVNVSSPAQIMSVTTVQFHGKGGRNRDKHVDVVVSVRNDAGDPVEGASVSIDLYSGSSFVARRSGLTDASGSAVIGYKNAPGGCYQVTVASVAAPPLTWDGVTPTNGSCR